MEGESITTLLAGVESGDSQAEDRLMREIYDELRAAAAGHLQREKSPVTLTATALVHEAYLRVFRGTELKPQNRRHLFFAFGRAMWRIVVERQRRKKLPRVSLELDEITRGFPSGEEVIRLDDALMKLGAEYPEEYETTLLHKVVGCSIEETASLLSVSPATVKRRWAFARALLARHLLRKSGGHDRQGPSPTDFP